MGFIKRFFIRRALKKASSKSDMDSVADETLKDALKELQATSRTADKILKAKMIRQESAHTLRKIQELDEDFEEEEAPQGDDMETTITNALINKFLGGAVPKEQSSQIQEIASKLSPEDINALKEKFL